MPVQKKSMESMGSIQQGKWGMQDGSRETGLQVGSMKLKMVLSTACGRHHAKEFAEKEVARDPTSSSHACKLAYNYLTLWYQRKHSPAVFVVIEPKGIIIVHGPIAGHRGILTTKIRSEYNGRDERRDLSEFMMGYQTCKLAKKASTSLVAYINISFLGHGEPDPCS